MKISHNDIGDDWHFLSVGSHKYEIDLIHSAVDQLKSLMTLREERLKDLQILFKLL